MLSGVYRVTTAIKRVSRLQMRSRPHQRISGLVLPWEHYTHGRSMRAAAPVSQHDQSPLTSHLSPLTTHYSRPCRLRRLIRFRGIRRYRFGRRRNGRWPSGNWAGDRLSWNRQWRLFGGDGYLGRNSGWRVSSHAPASDSASLESTINRPTPNPRY